MSDTPETDALCKRLEPLLEGLTIKNAQERLTQITRETLFHSERLELERDEAIRVANYWEAEASKECTLAQRANKERDELRAEIERLKADAELYSGWSKWKDGIWRISHPDSGPSAEWIAEDLQSAMKGSE